MTDEGEPIAVDELVEYCRTQAGLLSGRVETIGAETDDLLAEIDEEIAEIRSRLAEHTGGEEPSAAPPPATPGRGGAEEELAELEALETELAEKQTIAEAKQARIAAFQELAAAYVDLAEELASSVDDGQAALDRVVRFERDRDAPAYFDDRRTVLEAAAAEPDGTSADDRPDDDAA